MAGTLQFKRHQSSSFNSRFWVYDEVKRTVIKLCWML